MNNSIPPFPITLDRIVVCSLVLLINLCFASSAAGNGVGWDIGSVTTTPHPVKQDNLILQREHVSFGKNVKAHYWIFNPTQKKITVTMGFPIGLINLMGDAQEKAAFIRDYAKKFSDSFLIKIRGEKAKTSLLVNPGNEYPIVFTWQMTFPSGVITEYEAEYPLEWYGTHPDGGTDYIGFTYITHTGSYWAQPIGEATFEYCAKEMVEEMMKVPSGEYWLDYQTEYHVEWNVKPQPYQIDKKRGCIVWRRSKWSPKKGTDDIAISKSWRSISWKSPDMVDTWEEDNTINTYSDMRLKNWCGTNEYYDLGNDINITKGQFAQAIKLDTEYLTDDSLKKIVRWAYAYPKKTPDASVGLELPPHIETDFKLSLLSYLRNYLYAVHGHVFKDKTLSACFSNLSTRDRWSSVEVKNLEFIKASEKETKALDDKVRKELLKKMIKLE